MTDHKQNIRIDITGDIYSGKTQVAKIIKQALDNYGISVTVNSNENSYLEYEQFRQSNLNEACRKISQTTHVTVMDYNQHTVNNAVGHSRSEEEIDALRAQLPTDGQTVGDISRAIWEDSAKANQDIGTSLTSTFFDEHDLVPLKGSQVTDTDDSNGDICKVLTTGDVPVDDAVPLLDPQLFYLKQHPDMFPLRISEQESTSQTPIKRYTVDIPVSMYPYALDEVYVVGIHSVLARVGGNEVRLLIPNGDLRRIDVSDVSYFVTKQNKINKDCSVSFSYDNSSGLLTTYFKNVGKSIELLGVCLYGDTNSN